jgi:UDP-N-acetylmuramoylalanine--D-glutamate ligase
VRRAPVDLPRRALVVGLARSGHAAALALRGHGVEVVAHDRSRTIEIARLVDAGIKVHLGEEKEQPALLRGVDVVVKSPGIPRTMPLPAAARAKRIPIWSEIEVGARLLRNPLVGVTGTNGKTTTTALLGELFRAAGRHAEVAGNIGTPLTALVGQLRDDAWIVCELSSQQLEDTHTLAPAIAVLLNLEPDHIDHHGTYEAYADAKLRVFRNQRTDQVAVVPRGFAPVAGDACRVEFGADDPLPAEPVIRGRHNRENAAAATAAARAAGLDDEAIAVGLRSFDGVPHRIEDVAVVRGVRWVNDSKATNVAAARRALEAFRDTRLHVILGGLGKHESYRPLAADLKLGDRAYLIGDAAAQIAAALDAAHVPYVHCGELVAAVRAAAETATPGEVVLLSPACASFDQFEDFEARGEAFRRLVLELA